ncbi:hypothetical protein [Virgisporangium aurantiacum]|uniref:Uncharacterized protein n=1 Tax=Virgisporangium aurantiacum TaxID=175570 RepID=A0A8J3ZEH8_9ACTN|nr:hypothetical protein [Virgisporangium aurantiacum]GIJ62446.1 hypothetical protein Vau01_099620 [Virgisporangium aurantiacum]
MPNIEVDDAFMGQVEKTLRQLGVDIAASPHGPLANFTVKAGGKNFLLGLAVTERVKSMTQAVDSTLTQLSSTATNRANQISLYRIVTDDAESLNDTSAQDFLRDAPNWVQANATTK